jgi:hypothetical protein
MPLGVNLEFDDIPEIITVCPYTFISIILCSIMIECRDLALNHLLKKTKEVEEVYNVLSSLILCCTGIDKVITVSLPFNDVESPKDFIEVRETVRGIIRAGDYLDFTGGRKAISAAAVLAAREMGAHLVTSIIPHEEYDVLNKEYLRVKDVALRVYRKTDCVKSLCNLVSPHARTIVFF